MSRKFKATKPTGNPVASSSRFPEMPLTGTGMAGNGLWIWRLAAIRPDYLDVLDALSCKVVYLKIFDDLHGPSLWADQCSEELVGRFSQRGIKVIGWGYHFDKTHTPDLALSAELVSKGVACGLQGYVVDIETEVEDHSTHARVSALLTALRNVLLGKLLGYSSFGHPGLHPGMPWQILNDQCDAAFPQIYFENWSFGASTEDRVQSALKAHRDLRLDKPVLPIWGSEDNAVNPASAETLQTYLNRFPGSSLFRAPDVGQKGQAWRLNYGGGFPMLELPPIGDAPPGRVYSGTLKFGDTGSHVKDLQMLLVSSGVNPGPIDGHLGDMTQAAVKTYQLRTGLSPDGVVGPRTWASLGGRIQGITPPPNQVADKLANFAELEAEKSLRWTGPNSEAEKYLEPFRGPMQRLGQIGPSPVFYNWCAAFVAYCCRQVGIDIPDQPDGFWATMTLVESWKYWSRKHGTWLDPRITSPRRGDVVCFEWNDGDVALDHIGIVRRYAEGSTLLETSEGNRGNVTNNGTRLLASVAGVVRFRL